MLTLPVEGMIVEHEVVTGPRTQWRFRVSPVDIRSIYARRWRVRQDGADRAWVVELSEEQRNIANKELGRDASEPELRNGVVAALERHLEALPKLEAGDDCPVEAKWDDVLHGVKENQGTK